VSGGVVEEIRELLAEYNTDGIAGRLAGLGLTGRVADPCECPIARLVRAEVPAARDRRLWGDEPGQFGIGLGRVYTPDGWVVLPPRVHWFVIEFDLGRHEVLHDRG
jgi:hypothetical protein